MCIRDRYTTTYDAKAKQYLQEGKKVVLCPKPNKVKGRKSVFHNHFWNPIMFKWAPTTLGCWQEQASQAWDVEPGMWFTWKITAPSSDFHVLTVTSAGRRRNYRTATHTTGRAAMCIRDRRNMPGKKPVICKSIRPPTKGIFLH